MSAKAFSHPPPPGFNGNMRTFFYVYKCHFFNKEIPPLQTCIFLADKGFAPPPRIADVSAENVSFFGKASLMAFNYNSLLSTLITI